MDHGLILDDRRRNHWWTARGGLWFDRLLVHSCPNEGEAHRSSSWTHQPGSDDPVHRELAVAMEFSGSAFDDCVRTFVHRSWRGTSGRLAWRGVGGTARSRSRAGREPECAKLLDAPA